MSRLLCVGNSSKLPAQGAEKEKTAVLSTGEPAENKPVRSKAAALKSQPGGQPQGKRPSVISDRGQARGNFSRSEASAVLQASSQADVTTHGKEKLVKQTSPVCTAEDIGSSECVEKMHQDGPVFTVHQSQVVPTCPNTQSMSEEESGDDEDCGENEESESAENHAPIELLAEFLKAVMGKDYPMAKKLCQMILIYEPENPEAKHFLPLIEERILIEEAHGSSSEDKSDENEENSNEDNDDDADNSDDDSGDSDDDDEDSSSSDSDGEFTDSNSSASDEKEENISQ